MRETRSGSSLLPFCAMQFDLIFQEKIKSSPFKKGGKSRRARRRREKWLTEEMDKYIKEEEEKSTR